MNLKALFTWKRVAVAAASLWLLLQIVLIVVFWDVAQRSDQGLYMKMATECFEKGVWYPDVDSIYTSYIWAPGLINFFILQLKLFGTLKANFFLNLLMNVGILWNVWYLSNRFFSRRTAYIAVTLFCLMYSNVMVVLPAGTEVPFLFLSISALSLSLSPAKPRLHWIALAGVLLAFANWVRPLIIIFVPVILLYFWRNKSHWSCYAALLAPIVLLSIGFGLLAQRQMGYFVYQSTTSGINLIMTANDKAYGGVASSRCNDSTSTCYIKDVERYTFAERDSIRKTRAIEWIKSHPGRFATLYVMKLAGLYVEDSWPERPIIGGDGFVDKAAHGGADKASIVKRIWNMFYKSVVYYAVLLMFVIAVIKRRKDILTDKGYLLLLLLLGTLSTCIFSVSPRYHYPFFFAAIIWAAYWLDLKTAKLEKV